jgi:chromate transporter
VSDQAKFIEIATLFLKLGTIGFGGPTSTIAMMEDETVRKRKWISRDYFLEIMAVTNIVPGPNATEMAAHLGYIRAGFPGLLIAGLSFMLPATIISVILAIFYMQVGSLPQVNSGFSIINAVVIAILISALLRLSKPVYKTKFSLFLGGSSLIAALFDCNQVIIMLISGLISLFYYSVNQGHLISLIVCVLSFENSHFRFEAIIQSKLAQLGLFFLKVGSLLFGSTYILIAFIQQDLIKNFNWITEQQVIDAIAVGQITPGPISTTATFIGYVISGFPGSIISTVGMFLPSFIIVLITAKFLPTINHLSTIKTFLGGVSASAVALISFAIINLIKSTIIDLTTIVVASVALFISIKYKVDTLWLILGGVFLGFMKIFMF